MSSYFVIHLVERRCVAGAGVETMFHGEWGTSSASVALLVRKSAGDVYCAQCDLVQAVYEHGHSPCTMGDYANALTRVLYQ